MQKISSRKIQNKRTWTVRLRRERKLYQPSKRKEELKLSLSITRNSLTPHKIIE
jgi:hypothetical protein